MDKIWFIVYEGQSQGPYSVRELERDNRISRETYVWKDGFDDWVKLKKVPELQSVLKNKQTLPPPVEVKKPEFQTSQSQEDEVLALEGGSPNPWMFWVFIFVLILILVWYRWT